jgi:hypothetical protein
MLNLSDEADPLLGIGNAIRILDAASLELKQQQGMLDSHGRGPEEVMSVMMRLHGYWLRPRRGGPGDWAI